MEKITKDTKRERTLGDPFLDFPDLAQIGPAVFFKASMTYWHAMLSWQAELLHFLSGRLRSDAKLEHAMEHAGTVFDLMKLQQNWVSKAFKGYATEWAKLLSLTNQELLVVPDDGKQAAE